jgi:hypothetical protein
MSDGERVLLIVLFIGTPALLIALSIPLLQGRVAPNGWYGVRTRKTLSDERIWYAANRGGGRLLLKGGIVLLVGAVGLALVLDIASEAFAIAYLLLAAASLGTAIALMMRAIGRMDAETVTK